MPRRARFIINAIDELHRQLRYAPPATRLRHMNAAETLAGEIEPDGRYPEDYIIYRITGYRPDEADPPATFVGQALLRDLANLVQRLSEDLDLPHDHEHRRAISLEDVAHRWNVALRTVHRYRREGLICHVIRFPDGRQRVACFEDAMERFAASHRRRVEHAAQFSRIEEASEDHIIEQARTLRDEQNCTLNEAAKRIAERIGRAHETVRNMLQWHDRRSSEPIFTERGPLSEREIRLIHRAWKFGVPIPPLAKRFQRSNQTIHRAINRQRTMNLSNLPLSTFTLPTFEHEEADAILLAHPLVASDLWTSGDHLTDPIALIRAARKRQPTGPNDELALIAGYNFLKDRALQRRDQLSRTAGARMLDAIETDLRWTALLKRRLVTLAFPGALEAIEQHLGRSLEQQPGGMILDLIRRALRVSAATTDAIDPSRESHLLRRTRFAVDRALSQHGPDPTTARAAARHEAGSLALHEPMASLVPWWNALMPHRDVRAHHSEVAPEARDVIAARYGFDGGPPRTMRQLAALFAVSESAITRRLEEAERSLRQIILAASVHSPE